MKKDIFDLLKGLEDKSREIQSVFCESSFLDEEISILWAIIEDTMNIESCDESAYILARFGCGNLTKKQAIKKLKALSIIK
jgi:hypothetical protein